MGSALGDDDTNWGEAVNDEADDWLRAVAACLAEWQSPEDNEAFGDL